jgi:hypothetical protein
MMPVATIPGCSAFTVTPFDPIGRDVVFGEVCAGVVDHDVDLVVPLPDYLRGGQDVLTLGQIPGNDLESVRCPRSDAGVQGVCAGRVAGDGDHVCACAGEAGGDDLTHAAGRAGDDRDLVCQVGDPVCRVGERFCRVGDRGVHRVIRG